MGNRKTRRNTQLESATTKEHIPKNSIQSGYTYLDIYNTNGLARSFSAPAGTEGGCGAEIVGNSAPELFYSVKLLFPIGAGGTSQVFLGEDLRTRKKVAVKLVDTTGHKKGSSAVKNEVTILKELAPHKNIITFYGEKPLTGRSMLYFEYFPGTELFYLLKSCKTFSGGTLIRIFDQLVSAVAFLHAQRICHLDIKAENILISRSTHLKLIDFGMSKKALKNGLIEGYGGTINYTAPEAQAGGVYNGILADSWSCGVVLFLMANGYFPQEGNRSPHLPQTPRFLQQITHKLLESNPAKREPISALWSQHKSQIPPGDE
ncbi:hypothetical protein NEDG_01720 [Nematocida displodere]|uniref:Protein kinase domain-containing protein n=1 Tax=Nematocida displodere TaxID=1805483 RepID=A0A177EDW8_9MICR|nr:hypothetical protein NEDG_01720 [Nematocida displodere]